MLKKWIELAYVFRDDPQGLRDFIRATLMVGTTVFIDIFPGRPRDK